MTNPVWPEPDQAGELNKMQREQLDRLLGNNQARTIQPFVKDTVIGGRRDFRAIDTADYSPNREQAAYQRNVGAAVPDLDGDEPPAEVREEIEKEFGLDPTTGTSLTPGKVSPPSDSLPTSSSKKNPGQPTPPAGTLTTQTSSSPSADSPQDQPSEFAPTA